ncbi:MAG TPA: ATP synthase F1 subunit delta [Candidatus Moranbacteria bacterium]|nr:ATP synthase F1 subunit delta [Candidatus Moranbacteria bacterium]HBT46224.1 ATP synthase F1 subunit delta [Candidatus Moranbacteria bacterium]
MKVSIKQYSQTLFDLTDGKSEQEVLLIVKKFAQQLKNDGQLKNAAKIMEKFGELYNAANGIVVAEVTTKEKIEQEMKNKIEKFLKEKYSAKIVEIKNIIDEKIQGGIIIKVGDEVMDGSVKKQLNNLKKVLYS